LTAVLFPIALAGAGPRRDDKSFVAWLLLLEAGCLGSFLSLDLLVFFLFFELTLVPVYFIVSGFGHERRGYAATKFFPVYPRGLRLPPCRHPGTGRHPHQPDRH